MKNLKCILSVILVAALICTSAPIAFAAEEITISSVAEGVLVLAGNKITITSSAYDVELKRWEDGAWTAVADWTSGVILNEGENYFKATGANGESNVLTITGTKYELVEDRYKDTEAKTYTSTSTTNNAGTLSFEGESENDGIVVVEATVNLADTLGTWEVYPETKNNKYFGLMTLVKGSNTAGGIIGSDYNRCGDWTVGVDETIIWIFDYTTGKASAYVNGKLAYVWNRTDKTDYWDEFRIGRKVLTEGTTTNATIKVHAYTAKSVVKSAVLSAADSEMYAGYPHKLNLSVTDVEGTFDVEVYNGVEKVSTLSGQSAGAISVPYTPCEGANDVMVKIVSDGDVIESNTVSFVTTKKVNFYANEDYEYDSFDSNKIKANGWTASGSFEIVDTGNAEYGKSLKYTGTSNNLRITNTQDFGAGTTVVVENSWYFDSLPSSKEMYLFEEKYTKGDGNTGTFYHAYVGGGLVHVRYKGTGKRLTAKTWYDFKVVFEIAADGYADYTYYLDGDPLYVKLDGATSAACTYKTSTPVTLNQIKLYMTNEEKEGAYVDNSKIYTLEDLAFTSEVIDFQLGEVSAKPYEDTSDAKSICATVNSDGTEKTATMLCAVYSGDRLKSISLEPVSFAEGEYSKKFYGKVSGVESGNTIRAMLWNSMTDLEPFAEEKAGSWIAE